MTKIENIEFRLVERSEEYVCDFFQAILYQRFGSLAVFQYSDSFNIHILMFANEIRPYQCHADHRRQTHDAVDVAKVGIFDIESGGLHGAKACLNLPALFVGCHGCFRVAVSALASWNYRVCQAW